MAKPAINLWANFLQHEKLDPKALSNADVAKLIELCSKLAEKGKPYPNGHSHVARVAARRLVCTTAFDLGIDLMAMKVRKYHGGSKPAMGRGLLDIWNEEYKKAFGSTVGTSGASEVTRRTVVTRLAEQRRKETYAELQALIAEAKHSAKELSDRLNLPLPYVQNQMKHLCGCQVGTQHCLVHGETGGTQT